MRPLSESLAVTFIMNNGSVVHGFVRDYEGELTAETIHDYKRMVIDRMQYSSLTFIEIQGVEEFDVIIVKPSEIVGFRVKHAKIRDSRETALDPVGYGGRQN